MKEVRFSLDYSTLFMFLGRVCPLLDERTVRTMCGALNDALGRGSLEIISEISGLSKGTIIKGKQESQELLCEPTARRSSEKAIRVRKEGGGRKKVEELSPEVIDILRLHLDGNVIGNPEDPLCWTTKSTGVLSKLLKEAGYRVGPDTVGRLLKEMGFSLQQNRKYVERGSSPDRDQQFQYINDQSKEFMSKGLPVISVDTKKKELVGNYKNSGKEYRKVGDARRVNGHDFEGPEGKAAPYGIYDIGANEGFVNVGISSDTAEFACASIERWWNSMGLQRYSNANKLMITADCGGSNGNRTRLWKTELQKLADKTGLEIQVSHFPPGTSKWNKIEHRLFAQISRHWRGQPLESIEVIIALIASTTTETGLTVKCELDSTEYQTGIKVSDDELLAVNLVKHAWRGDWNYTIYPNAQTV